MLDTNETGTQISKLTTFATFGQFMLFKREAYEKIGGHEGIKDIPINDFALGHATKKRGLRWMLFEGANSVKVLPYSGNIDAFTSVSRIEHMQLDH